MRKELYPLFGIVTVLNTPFAADGQVSLDALEKHIHYAIEYAIELMGQVEAGRRWSNLRECLARNYTLKEDWNNEPYIFRQDNIIHGNLGPGFFVPGPDLEMVL